MSYSASKASNVGVMLPDRPTLLPLGDGKDNLMFEIFSVKSLQKLFAKSKLLTWVGKTKTLVSHETGV